jgi:glyoxylate/hydroxypyruvate reductase A
VGGPLLLGKLNMLLLHLADVDEAEWAEKFRAALGDYPVVRRGDAFDATDVRYIFVWKPASDAFDGLTGLKAVFSLGAGVDALVRHEKLPDVPLVRFVDPGLSQRMSDYVVAQVMMHHRLHTRYAADQQARRWDQLYPPAAAETTVGIMGLGVLGADAAARLRPQGFTLRGWSRNRKAIAGVACFAGADEFDAFLGGTDILVNLLPLTPETEGILNYETFQKLRRGRLAGGPAMSTRRAAATKGKPTSCARSATARWARRASMYFRWSRCRRKTRSGPLPTATSPRTSRRFPTRIRG